MSKDIFVNIGNLFLIINSILLLKGFSGKGKPFKIFGLYCLAMCFVQFSALIMVKMHMHNLFLSHFYFILQFVLLSMFYYHLFKENFQKKIIVVGLALCLSLLFIQYALDWSHFNKFNLFEIFITTLPLIIYATFHLYNLLNEKKEFYYITIGLLIYLFGSTIVFLTSNLLISLNSKSLYKMISRLNVYLYIVYQLFILYEIVMVYIIRKSNKVYE